MKMHFSIRCLALPVIAITIAVGAASLITSSNHTAAATQEEPLVVATISFNNKN